MKAILFLLTIIYSYNLQGQVFISTYEDQMMYYDEDKEKYEPLEDEITRGTFFKINKGFTMMEHTTEDMTSHYKIEKYIIDDSTGVFMGSLVSDVGNKYRVMIDKEYNYVLFEYPSKDTVFVVNFYMKSMWGDSVDKLTGIENEQTVEEAVSAKNAPVLDGTYQVDKIVDYNWSKSKKKYEAIKVVGKGALKFDGDKLYFKRGDANWLDNELIYKGFNKEKGIHIFKDKRGQKLYVSESLDKLTYYYDYDEPNDKYHSATLYKGLNLVESELLSSIKTNQ